MVVQDDLQGWALILGGSSGLGLATALKLAHHGMDIIIVHRDRRTTMLPLENAIAEISALGRKVLTYNIDATRRDKMQEVVTAFANDNIKIKALIHSISRGNVKPLSGNKNMLTEEDFISTCSAMSFSLAAWVQALAIQNRIETNARIIAYTSEGSQRPYPAYAAVSAAKASIEAIIRSISVEYAHLHIRANSIQAGVTDTPSLRMIPGVEDIITGAEQRSLSGRMTTATDIANAAYLLCRPEGDWINGTILTVDGGESLR